MRDDESEGRRLARNEAILRLGTMQAQLPVEVLERVWIEVAVDAAHQHGLAVAVFEQGQRLREGAHPAAAAAEHELRARGIELHPRARLERCEEIPPEPSVEARSRSAGKREDHGQRRRGVPGLGREPRESCLGERRPAQGHEPVEADHVIADRAEPGRGDALPAFIDDV